MAKKTEKPRPGPKSAAKPSPVSEASTALVLDRLWAVIVQRRNADPAISHSARLLSRGPAKVAQKFGEEAVECVIEAVIGNPDAQVAESADVLYHLLVMWVAAGIEPAMVWAELERREGMSGIAEKAARLLPVAARSPPKAAKSSPKAAKSTPKAKSSPKAPKPSPKAAPKAIPPKLAKSLPLVRGVGTRKIP